MGDPHHLETVALELALQILPGVTADVAEDLVGLAPQPRMPGDVHDDAATRPHDACGLAEHRARIRCVLDDVEEAHHRGDAVARGDRGAVRHTRQECMPVVRRGDELDVAVERQRMIRRPSEHGSDAAGAGPDVDEQPTARREPPDQQRDEGRLAAKPPVRPVGARESRRVGVAEDTVAPHPDTDTDAGGRDRLRHPDRVRVRPDPRDARGACARRRAPDGPATPRGAATRRRPPAPGWRGPARRDHLDVPREAVFAGMPEHGAPDLGARGLGAALGVRDAGNDRELDRAVVRAAEQLTRATLTEHEPRRGRPP